VSALLQKYQDTSRALGSLEEIIDTPFSIVVRDAAIQRFEYTVEVLWKYVKVYLSRQEGLECYSPKSCIRELLAVDVLEEDDIVLALEMIDDRNRTSHTYHEAIAESIYHKLPDYLALMQTILPQLQP